MWRLEVIVRVNLLTRPRQWLLRMKRYLFVIQLCSVYALLNWKKLINFINNCNTSSFQTVKKEIFVQEDIYVPVHKKSKFKQRFYFSLTANLWSRNMKRKEHTKWVRHHNDRKIRIIFLCVFSFSFQVAAHLRPKTLLINLLSRHVETIYSCRTYTFSI